MGNIEIYTHTYRSLNTNLFGSRRFNSTAVAEDCPNDLRLTTPNRVSTIKCSTSYPGVLDVDIVLGSTTTTTTTTTTSLATDSCGPNSGRGRTPSSCHCRVGIDPRSRPQNKKQTNKGLRDPDTNTLGWSPKRRTRNGPLALRPGHSSSG